MSDKMSDFAKGYEKGHSSKPTPTAEIIHQSIGMTESEVQKEQNPAYKAGKEQGTADKKAGK